MDLTPPFVLLEDRLTPGAPARLYLDPVEIVQCSAPEGVDAALASIEAGLSQGLHAAGALAYELGHVLEGRLTARLPARRSTPLIEVGLFAEPLSLSQGQLDEAFAGRGAQPPIRDLRAGRDRPTHVAMVKRLLAAIAAGEVYQANLTFPMHFAYDGDPLRLYAALRVRQPTAHAAVVALGDGWTLSASPELFLRVRDGQVESRPMKGTIARAADRALDEAAAASLRADPKQRAENIMIVDLLRNDLSRIAAAGSVEVPELLTVETYPDLHTLTSTITARLRSGVGPREILKAAFPCGSVVGAPKIAAAELLSEVERNERGVYTGAIGAFAPNGDVQLNVAIRTLRLLPDGSGCYGVGGGIVADSDPDAEYEEALLKARPLQDLARDYQLIETLRWSRTVGLVRGAEHLDRMQGSAEVLAFRFDRAAIEADLSLRAAAWALTSPTDRRIRLLLQRSGAFSVEDTAFTAPDRSLLRLDIADNRLDAGDPLNRHKTTLRGAYDAAAAQAARAGWDEAILLNRGGQVADASRHTVFAQLQGRLVTPPLAAGALPGVLRACLLRTGEAVEGALNEADLRSAEALFVGNSLRGLQPAALLDRPCEQARPISATRFGGA